MQNIRLTLQYDGTRYLGWQRPQKDGHEKTVSYKISSVLKKMTGEEITLHVGAKTEAGVHAAGQTVSFQTDSAISPEQFRSELNRYLPQDIAVLSASAAPERFRADLSAVSRTYEYRIWTAKIYDVFSAPYTAHLPIGEYTAEDAILTKHRSKSKGTILDRNAMQEAAALLIARHDFLGFSGARSKKKTEKEIHEIRITHEEEHLLTITLTADNFLFRMPSLIMGTLMEVCVGKRTPESIRDILEGREKAAALCDAKGLLLKSISYD